MRVPERAARPSLTMAAAAAFAGWAITAARLHTRTRQLHHAHRDPVSGLLTRAAWEPAAQAALRHRGGTLGLVDLDGFKAINDTFGHDAGDHVLHAVATRLTTTLGAEAVVGRLGGDEFAFVSARTDLTPAELDRLLAALTAPIRVVGAGDLPIGASVGLSTSDRTTTLSDALSDADRAMYEAKALRSGWRRHTPGPAAIPEPRARHRTHQEVSPR
ncbi:GGDEF domain-containing protein [Saccharopolyspora cebuensis]|uniref:GGDEF domain-containing protein n=1 Tax=Saccharopolyspora cebuensis TaxID=418759 RepID=A0ABV4CMP0_9PSEU